jgi:hypothetical protein
MLAAPARRPPLTFWSKALAALLLVVLADWLFLFHEPGLSIGVFATAWLVLTALTQRALWHDRRAWAALAAALVFAVAQVDHVSLLAWVLFCTALGTAVLLPGAKFGDAWRWAQKLLVHGLVALFGPLIDLRRLRKTGRLPPMRGALRLLPLLALPVIGGLVFLLLFASANPLISSALGPHAPAALQPRDCGARHLPGRRAGGGLGLLPRAAPPQALGPTGGARDRPARRHPGFRDPVAGGLQPPLRPAERPRRGLPVEQR